MKDAARLIGQWPRFAAGGVHEPDLTFRFVVRTPTRRTRAEKGEPLAVRRPARLEAVVRAARQRCFATRGQLQTHEVADLFVSVFVRDLVDPDGPVAIR